MTTASPPASGADAVGWLVKVKFDEDEFYDGRVEWFDSKRQQIRVLYEEGEFDWLAVNDQSLQFVRKLTEGERIVADSSSAFRFPRNPNKLAAEQMIDRAHLLWSAARFDGAAKMYADAIKLMPVEELAHNKEAQMAVSRSAALRAYHKSDDGSVHQSASYCYGQRLQVIPLKRQTSGADDTQDKSLADFAFRLRGITDGAKCASLIDAAESHALLNGGWCDHHGIYNGTTLTVADLEVHNVPPLCAFVNAQLEQCIWPLLSEKYEVGLSRLRLLDCFFVRYDAAEATNFLRVHTDESALSFVVELSQPGVDFVGGGTKFEALNAEPANGISGAPVDPAAMEQPEPEQAAILVFAGGQVPHRGQAISAGRRYIIAGFVGVAGSSAADRL